MYATKQDMIDRFGEEPLIELTDRADPPAGVIDDAVLDAALIDASALIDSYIARRYELPLAGVPLVVKGHCMAIAWYRLHRGRVTDETRTDYTDALTFLRELSTGMALLDIGGTEPASANAQVRAVSSGRTFSRQKGKEGWM